MFLLLFLFCASFSSAFSVEFYHSDHLGSPSVITDEAGKVVWSADYDTFGDAVNEQGENDIKYNSKEEDKTGLLYYGARYYNPETGRFITADTVKGNLIDSQSQNRYVYVKNNPLKYIDPTGNEGEANKYLTHNANAPQQTFGPPAITTEMYDFVMEKSDFFLNTVTGGRGQAFRALTRYLYGIDTPFDYSMSEKEWRERNKEVTKWQKSNDPDFSGEEGWEISDLIFSPEDKWIVLGNIQMLRKQTGTDKNKNPLYFYAVYDEDFDFANSLLSKVGTYDEIVSKVFSAGVKKYLPSFFEGDNPILSVSPHIVSINPMKYSTIKENLHVDCNFIEKHGTSSRANTYIENFNPNKK